MKESEQSPLCAELMTVRDFIRYAASEFNRAGVYYGHGTDNAWDEAVQLVTGALHLSGLENPHILDARVLHSEKVRIIQWIRRRVDERVPVAYLTGFARFCDLDFYVDERVLVPRSPIAELIAAGFAPWLREAPDYVLDLCAGSGCIGIACAYYFPEAEVTLSDVSADALAVAQRNVERHQLTGRVAARQSDLFDQLQGQCFDLIVCNPPYVDAQDLAAMPAEYHAEPALGLGSGDDGLDFTRRLLAQAAAHLNDGGLLVVEVGNSAAALAAAYPALDFQWVDFERGGHGVFVLEREALVAL